MRQAVMTEPGKIEFGDVAEPKAGEGEILMRIKRIGVCGSDIHVNKGKHPFTSYPIVQGHEFSAVVEAIGPGVDNVKVGQKVTARPQVVCGKCGPCKRGDYNVCQNLKVEGFQTNGCAQDLFVTTTDKIVPLPDSFTYEQGALIEPASCGAHGTRRAGDLTGKNVVVLGAATIGNMIAQCARARGAKDVLICNYSGGYKLEVAKQCGIEKTFAMKDMKLADAVKKFFGDEGVQVAIECAGSPDATTQAIQVLEKGGTFVILGVFEENPVIDMGALGEHELSLIGSMMYKHEDYLDAVKFIESGAIVTEPLVSKSFPFEKYMDAYKYIDDNSRNVMKVMIDLEQ